MPLYITAHYCALLHGFVHICTISQTIVWACAQAHGPAHCCTALCTVTWSCALLLGVVQFCMAMYKVGMALFDVARLQCTIHAVLEPHESSLPWYSSYEVGRQGSLPNITRYVRLQCLFIRNDSMLERFRIARQAGILHLLGELPQSVSMAACQNVKPLKGFVRSAAAQHCSFQELLSLLSQAALALATAHRQESRCSM